MQDAIQVTKEEFFAGKVPSGVERYWVNQSKVKDHWERMSTPERERCWAALKDGFVQLWGHIIVDASKGVFAKGVFGSTLVVSGRADKA